MTSDKSVADIYRSGSDKVASGEYEINFHHLPPVAEQSVDSSNITISELIEKSYALPDEYKHLAWWTCEHFLGQHASRDDQFLAPNAAALGFVEMAKFLSDICLLYSAQPNRPSDYAAQVEAVRDIALRSWTTLEFIAKQDMPTAGVLERNLGVRESPNALGWILPQRDAAVHRLELVLDDDGYVARGKFVSETTRSHIRNRYQEEMAHDSKDAQRVKGCIALKIAADNDNSVFFTIWHGMTLAAAKNSELFEAGLRQVDQYSRQYLVE